MGSMMLQGLSISLKLSQEDKAGIGGDPGARKIHHEARLKFVRITLFGLSPLESILEAANMLFFL